MTTCIEISDCSRRRDVEINSLYDWLQKKIRNKNACRGVAPLAFYRGDHRPYRPYGLDVNGQ